MKTTKMLLLYIPFGVMGIFNIQAQSPSIEWAGQAGGGPYARGHDVITDAVGNVITTGYFEGTADFDPDPVDVMCLTSNGKEDIFIQKLDAEGNLIWAASMGDTAMDRGWSVITDSFNNIYLTGSFKYTMDVDPGEGEYYLSCIHNAAFILKFNADGLLIWAKQMGSPVDYGNAFGYSLTLDDNLNVITTGFFMGSIDFDPGNGIFNMLSGGSGDVYIQKLDAAGNFIWAKQITGDGYAMSQSIDMDVSGNIYIMGSFGGTKDFNPAKKTRFNMTSMGNYDTYIQKLDGNGNFVWAKQVGGTDYSYGYSLTIENTGNIYGTGAFMGTVDFNPGSGIFNYTSVGQSDMFILKLNLAGSFIWAKQFGGPEINSGGSVATDIEGNVYVSGYSYGTADFDPDPVNTYFITANGADDIIIYKSDPDGNFIWVAQMGGTGHDYAVGLAVDASGNIYTTGGFTNTVDFDPGGNGTFELTSMGAHDVFVHNLNPSGVDDCVVPAGLAATNSTEISADLGWNAVSGAGGYYVRYREIDTDWITLADMISGTSLAISGLTFATSYEFQVKTDCYSNYSYSGEFTTPGGGCPDNYEPNETMSAAALIPVNTDITALIASAIDLDYFTFSTTNAAKNIKITLNNLPANYDIVLYKSNGSQIGISQNTGTIGETIIYNTNKAGTYYIKVYGAGGAYDPINCYTLKAAVSSKGYKSAEAEIYSPDITDELTVYPNPSHSVFNFRLETTSKELISIQLFDLSGRLVQEYKSLSPDNIITIGENLENGVYIAAITQRTHKIFIRIAKVQ